MSPSEESNPDHGRTATTGDPDASLGPRPERGKDRERQVRTLFSEIAPRYDLLNRILSLSVDRWWRRVAVRRLRAEMSAGAAAVDRPWILDACAGTLDLSIDLSRLEGFRGRIAAVDFAFPMLRLGKGKLGSEERRAHAEGPAGASSRPGILPVCGDGLRLPFPDAAFDGAMVAFGVRNLADLRRGLSELARVLRPGAPLLILEFTTPPGALMRRLYLFYFRRVLPLVGRIVSGHRWAYTYLPESVKEFPAPAELARTMEEEGFARVEWNYLTAGISAIHLGRKV